MIEKKEKLVQVPPHQPGWYLQRLVYNCTANDVILVDRFDNEIVITASPCCGKGSQGVVFIITREENGNARYRGVDNQPYENQLEAVTHGFQIHEFEVNPLYIEELDMMMCVRTNRRLVVHPANITRSRGVNVTPPPENPDVEYQMLVQSLFYPRLTLIANDPSGKVNHLFAWLCGEVVQIGVSNNPCKPAGIFWEINDGSTRKRTTKIDFDALLAGETIYLKDGSIYCLAYTEDLLLAQVRKDHVEWDELQALRKDRSFIPRIIHENEINHLKEQAKKDFDAMKENLEEKIKEQDLDNKKLKNSVKEAEQAKADSDTSANEWRTRYQTLYQQEQDRAKLDAEKAKAATEEQKRKTEKAKTTETWVKVAIPIATAVIGCVVTVMATKAKNNKSK